MLREDDLVIAFLARAVPVFEATSEDIGGLLKQHVDNAVALWPSLGISPEHFVSYIAERVTTLEQLRVLRAADLYLACACAMGNSAAIRAFEEDVLSKTRGALKRMDKQGDLVEEIQQVMRIEFLVGSPEAPPKIVDYLGQGSLQGWTKVAATRRALKSFRKGKREVALEDWDVAEGMQDGVLENMRSMYQKEFRQAFETAFGELDTDERNLLRLHIIDDVSIDGIAKVLKIHRATAARRLGNARASLAEKTKEVLVELVGAGDEGVESILRLVRSRLDISMRRILDEK